MSYYLLDLETGETIYTIPSTVGEGAMDGVYGSIIHEAPEPPPPEPVEVCEPAVMPAYCAPAPAAVCVPEVSPHLERGCACSIWDGGRTIWDGGLTVWICDGEA